MRFLITAGPCSNDARPEAAKPPDEGLLAAQMKCNEDTTKAGVLIAADSLEEAIGWALEQPLRHGHDFVLEIRRLAEISDLTPGIQKVIAEAAPTWSAPLRRTQTKGA